jgi:hypothetical protein
VQLGPLKLGDMGQGRVRPLTSREVHDLYAAVGLGASDTDPLDETDGYIDSGDT